MKKILQVCNTDFYLKKFLTPLISELRDNGFEIHTACNTSNDFQSKKDDEITHHNVNFPNSPNPISFYKSIRQLIKIIKQNKYKCVNSHNRNASIAARIAAWWCKVPFNIYTAHGFYYHDDQSNKVKWLTIQLERLLAKLTTFTLSQSQEDVDLMVERGYIAANKIAWIGNGIDHQKFIQTNDKTTLRKQLKLPSDKFTISAVGRLVKGKGFQDLIKAFVELNKNNKNTHLVIIGGSISQDIDSFNTEIVNLINSNQLQDHITLTGMVDNVEDFLAASDVYVLPSYREGVSRSMLEAMSCQVPVIVTKIRGCRELIENEVNGLMFEPHNYKQLLNHLKWLYKHPLKGKQYATHAYSLIERNHNQTQYTQRQVKIITQIINS